MGAKAIGHGGGFDLGHSKKEPNNGRDLERIERWFGLYPKLYRLLPRYWYDVLIMTIKGGLLSIVPVAIIAVNTAAGAVIMLLGGLVGFPAAYMLGWALYDHTKLLGRLGATEFAEFVSGALFFGSFVLAVFMLV